MFRRLALAWNRRQQRIAVLACLLLVCLVTGVVACNIPVFRYALERWKPDACEIIVFHDGPLSSADMGSLAKLQAIIDDGQANAKLIRVDVAGAASQDSSQDASPGVSSAVGGAPASHGSSLAPCLGSQSTGPRPIGEWLARGPVASHGRAAGRLAGS